MFCFRPEESQDPTGHSIQSVSLAPEDNQTRVSLTIGTKSAPSSPRSNRRNFNRSFDSTDSSAQPKKNTNVPTGQAYMQKLVGSLNDLDDDDRMGKKYFSFQLQNHLRMSVAKPGALTEHSTPKHSN